MVCRKCGTGLTVDNIKLSIAAHDEGLLDIIITCPECELVVNNFVSAAEFVEVDEEL
jgi:RNase P subunit RPR2